MIIGLQMEVRTMKFSTKILLMVTLLVTMVPAMCSAGAVTVDSFPDIKIQYVDSFPGVR